MQRLAPTTPPPHPLADHIAAERRHRSDGRPWVLLNMVTSLDGATAIDGASGALGATGDREMFDALRSIADVVVVAGGTARAENYGPPQLDDETRDRRTHRGQEPVARLAVVSASLDFDPGARLFDTGRRNVGASPPLLLTIDNAPEDRRAALAPLAEIRSLGPNAGADAIIDELAGLGAAVVLAEGGPSFNGQLLAADLVDELCLTLAPLTTLGTSNRLATGDALAAPHRFALDRTFEADGELLLRYLRLGN